MKRFVYLKLTRQEAQSLARIFALMEVNMRVNPEIYSQKAKDLHSLFEQLDYQIHEVAKMCDREDCSYWSKKKALTSVSKNQLAN